MVNTHIGTIKYSIIYKVEADTSSAKTLTFSGQFMYLPKKGFSTFRDIISVVVDGVNIHC